MFVVEQRQTPEGIVDQQLLGVRIDLEGGALQGEVAAHELCELEGRVQSADAVQRGEGVVPQEEVAAVGDCPHRFERLLRLQHELPQQLHVLADQQHPLFALPVLPAQQQPQLDGLQTDHSGQMVVHFLVDALGLQVVGLQQEGGSHR